MDIKSLIDKFMNGTSSLEEEQMLGSYFRTEKHLPKELKPYRKMFAYFDGGMKDRDLLRGGAESPDDKPFCMEATVATKRQNKKNAPMASPVGCCCIGCRPACCCLPSDTHRGRTASCHHRFHPNHCTDGCSRHAESSCRHVENRGRTSRQSEAKTTYPL